MSTTAHGVQTSSWDCAYLVWLITQVGNQAGAPTYAFNADAFLK